MKKLGMLFFASLLVSLSLVWAAGGYLSKPAHQSITMPEEFKAVAFNGTQGSYLESDGTEVCALLMHGVRSNRISMIGRSKFLNEMGIPSLLIDLQAHGETPGKEITFGIRESIDAENGVKYLRDTKQCTKILAIGRSLGGAAALLGNGPIQVDALILESVYPTIKEAVQDRLEIRLGTVGRLAAPLLYWQIPLRINASLSELQPIKVLESVNFPVFIISGSQDEHTKTEETQRMFAAVNATKQLWLVDGAAHEDLFLYDTAEYKEKIKSFIDCAL